MIVNRHAFLGGASAALLAGCAGKAVLPTATAGEFAARPLPVEPIVGEIRPFHGTRPPNAWMVCDGRALPIESYRPLYAVLGQCAAPRDPHTGRRLHGDATHFYIPDSAPDRYVIAVRGASPRSPRELEAIFARRSHGPKT